MGRALVLIIFIHKCFGYYHLVRMSPSAGLVKEV